MKERVIMAYHTTPYLLLFLPAALLFYQITPAKWRSYTLLIFSYLFFWSFSEKLIIYLIGTTFLTHHICIWMDTMDKRDKRKKRVFQLGILLLLGTILCLKYRNFFFGNVSKLAMVLHIDWSYQDQLIFLPIGISFYTLSAIGYMADVYWGKVKAEYSLVKTALFLGFFPVIVEGPICRWEDVEDTLFKNESVKAENVFKGCYRIIWGLFKKMIIADRLAVLVDKVYVGYESYSGAVDRGSGDFLYDTVVYGIFGLYGYGHRKCRTFWNSPAGEFQSAVFCKDMYRFLETMAHYAWCLVQKLYLLSSIHFQDGQKVE